LRWGRSNASYDARFRDAATFAGVVADTTAEHDIVPTPAPVITSDNTLLARSVLPRSGGPEETFTATVGGAGAAQPLASFAVRE